MADIKRLSEYISDPEHTICFSGHRPKGLGFKNPYNAYRDVSYTTMNYEFMQDLMKLVVSKNITRFITGGAQGWDQLCFSLIEKMRKYAPGFEIQNIVFIPFIGQENKWLENGMFGKKEYRNMLEKADAVYVVHEEQKGNFQTICSWLDDRNKKMIDASSICMFAEKSNEPLEQLSKGGTYNCYKYALKQGVEISRFTYDITPTDFMVKHI